MLLMKLLSMREGVLMCNNINLGEVTWSCSIHNSSWESGGRCDGCEMVKLIKFVENDGCYWV